MKMGLLALVLAIALGIGWGGASLASAEGRATASITPPVISPGTPTEAGFIMGPNISLEVMPQDATLLTVSITGPVIVPPNPVFPPNPVVPPSPVIEIFGPITGP